MMSLIMLGLIPGTNIQITFETWLVAMLVFGIIITAVFAHHRWVMFLANLSKFFRQATDNLRATVRPV